MHWIFGHYGMYFWSFAIVLLWLYKRFSYNHWQKLNINTLKPVPVFGNFLDFMLCRKSYQEIINDLYRSLGDEPLGGVYQMGNPYLLIKDPELISNVLMRDFKFFSSHGSVLYISKKGAMAKSVSLASGERWRMLRRKMNSAFTSYKMERMHRHVLYCVVQLTEFVDKQMDATESTDIDMNNVADRFTAEVAGLCFFGILCHSFERDHNEFIQVGHLPFTTTFFSLLQLILSAFSKRLSGKLNFLHVNEKLMNVFRDMILDVVGHRRQLQENRNDLLQILSDLQNSHVDPKFAVAKNGEQVPENEEFNEMDIFANAYALHIAGFETTSTTLAFCLYELALNENIQERLRAEVQWIKDQYVELNYNSLKQMTYMDAVIAETLRKYPPAPCTSRRCVEDYVISAKNIRIPAGTKIIIPIWSIHHDWRYYPNPEVFDPERFMGDRKYKQSNELYLPYGVGPRICLGKNFAEMELKTAISNIILKYNIKPCAKTEVPVKFSAGSLALCSSRGIWVNFTKR